MDNKPPEPDWAIWSSLADVELDEAVALSLNVEPEWLRARTNRTSEHEALYTEQMRRTRIVMSHKNAGTLAVGYRELPPPPYSGDWGRDVYFVTLAGFRSWGESLRTPFEFPEKFPAADPIVQAATAPAEELDPRAETSMLRVIAALMKSAGMDPSTSVSAVERQLELLGLEGPKEATIRGILRRAANQAK